MILILGKFCIALAAVSVALGLFLPGPMRKRALQRVGPLMTITGLAMVYLRDYMPTPDMPLTGISALGVLLACAFLSGGAGVYLGGAYVLHYPKRAYFVMLALPVLTLSLFTGYLFSQVPLSPERQDARDIARLEKQLEDNPYEPVLSLELAGIYIHADKLDMAILLLENVLIRDDLPNKSDLLTQLGTAYFARGLRFAEDDDMTHALEDLQKADEIAPADVPWRGDLAHFIQKVSNHEAAPLPLPAVEAESKESVPVPDEGPGSTE